MLFISLWSLVSQHRLGQKEVPLPRSHASGAPLTSSCSSHRSTSLLLSDQSLSSVTSSASSPEPLDYTNQKDRQRVGAASRGGVGGAERNPVRNMKQTEQSSGVARRWECGATRKPKTHSAWQQCGRGISTVGGGLLSIVPRCASLKYRQYSGHRHYWE